jgi:hypothetical protein
MLAKRWPLFLTMASVVGMLCLAARVYIATVLLSGQGLFPPILGQYFVYSRTVISTNYFDDELVRRGLSGTIASLLSNDWTTSGVLFMAVSVIWLIVPLALLIWRLGNKLSWAPSLYMAGILVLSPQTFNGWTHDLIRTDVFVVGFIAWAAFATMAGHRSVGLIILLIGFLAHETALVFGLPILLVLNAHAYASGEIDKRSGIQIIAICFAGLVLIVLAQSILRVPDAVIADHMTRAVPETAVPETDDKIARDIAIYMMVSGIRGIKTAICYNVDFNPQYYITSLFCLTILAAYAFILPLRKHYVAMLIAAFVPVIFMMLIANDTGRWLKMGVANAWMLAAYYKLRGPKVEPSWPAMGIGLLLFAGLVAMRHTPLYYVNETTHNISRSLGYADPGRLEDWMNHCDPEWRKFL